MWFLERVLALAAAALLAAAPPPSPCELYAALVARDDGPRTPAACAEALADSCDAGRRHACLFLGRVLEAGTAGAPADLARAQRLYERTCSAGLPEGCTRLAGLVAPADPARARSLLEEGCAAGSASACAQRSAAEADPARAARLRTRACDLGDGDACVATATALPEARRTGLLDRACALHSAAGCAGAARQHLKRDPALARALLERGCELGGGEACALLGLGLIAVGDEDLPEGLRLLREHCPALPAAECVAAARAHLGGPGAALGRSPSPALLEAACQAGDGPACAKLGRLYQEGVAVPGDGARAAALYRQACDAGAAEGCTGLGVLHRFGAGVPEDEAAARALLQRGCQGGDAEACRLVDDPVRPMDGAAGAGPADQGR
ncbi:MAG: tetratricopeptide repeat protein [Anaeromyxobacter sp.]